MGHLGDDADVGGPAPLPVGDNVHAGRLLHADGEGDTCVEAVLPALLLPAVDDDLTNVVGPWQGSDDGRGKQGTTALYKARQVAPAFAA